MKILIVRLSSLGDIVLTQAFTSELRRIYPDSEIHYLTKQAFVGIVKLFGTVDKVLVYDKTLASHIAIHMQNYDIVYDLHSKLSAALISLFAMPAVIHRYNKARIKRQNIVRTHAKTGIDFTVRLYLSAFRSVEGYSIPKHLPIPRLNLPTAWSSSTTENIAKTILIPRLDNKLSIALFPGAAHQTKMFPLDKLREIIDYAKDRYHFFLLGSEAERPLCSSLAMSCPESCTDLCGKFTLADLIKVIGLIDIVITNDSGPMHLAAALGKPQIAIFGATHPSLGFSPMNSNARIVCKDLDCQPCSLHGGERCPLNHFNCMNQITAEEVLNAIRSLHQDSG